MAIAIVTILATALIGLGCHLYRVFGFSWARRLTFWWFSRGHGFGTAECERYLAEWGPQRLIDFSAARGNAEDATTLFGLAFGDMVKNLPRMALQKLRRSEYVDEPILDYAVEHRRYRRSLVKWMVVSAAGILYASVQLIQSLGHVFGMYELGNAMLLMLGGLSLGIHISRYLEDMRVESIFAETENMVANVKALVDAARVQADGQDR